MAKNLLTVDSVTGQRKQKAIDSDYIRAGVTDIANGAQSVDVVFSSPVPTANYAVTPVLQRLGTTTPQFQPITITAKSESGFTARLNAITEDASYKLNWITMPLI